MTNRSVITSTVGYMSLALALWMMSMPAAGWYERAYPPAEALMLPLAVVLGVMGILAFLHGRTLDSIIFFAGAGLFWSSRLLSTAASGSPASYSGWYFFVWAVFFCYVWFGSFRAGSERMVFLLGMWLGLLALAIGDWSELHILTLIGGYLGLITAVIAAVTSATGIIRFGTSGDPNGRTEQIARTDVIGDPLTPHLGAH